MNYIYKIIEDSCDVKSFCCGDKEEHIKLDQFLKEHAIIDQNDMISVTTVILDNKSNKRVIGFMTLLSDNVQVEESKRKTFVKNHKIKHKYNFYPALKIGRIAVDKQYQNRKIGTYLFELVVGIATFSNEELGIGIRFLIVDSKNIAKKWYLDKLRFKVYDDEKPNFLYYDLKGWND